MRPSASARSIGLTPLWGLRASTSEGKVRSPPPKSGQKPTTTKVGDPNNPTDDGLKYTTQCNEAEDICTRISLCNLADELQMSSDEDEPPHHLGGLRASTPEDAVRSSPPVFGPKPLPMEVDDPIITSRGLESSSITKPQMNSPTCRSSTSSGLLGPADIVKLPTTKRLKFGLHWGIDSDHPMYLSNDLGGMHEIQPATLEGWMVIDEYPRVTNTPYILGAPHVTLPAFMPQYPDIRRRKPPPKGRRQMKKTMF